MIHDRELSALFQVETDQHLQSLDEGLLRLEANPGDRTTLEEVFRSAHSLKGAARMLGVATVEAVAHEFEEELGGARRGLIPLTSELVVRLYKGLDAIRIFVHEAISGEPAGIDPDQVVAFLKGELPGAAAAGGNGTGATEAAGSVDAPERVEWAPEGVVDSSNGSPGNADGGAPVEAPVASPDGGPEAPGPGIAATPAPAFIEDAELRALFQAETEEHLRTLDDGLLRLEAEPGDSATLEEVFRSAHSVKGAARMLGVTSVERIAHEFEEALGAAKRGIVRLSPETVDRLYGALDSIRALVGAAITGAPAAVDVAAVLARLKDGPESAAAGRATAAEAPPASAEAPPAPDPVEAEAAFEPAPPPPAPPVPPAKVPYIEDAELRGLFQVECAEHLQTLDDGLLRLEGNPGDVATLEEVFRSAHSLKGAGRMVGVGGVERISHVFEDELGAAKRGQATLTPETVDRLYRGLDAIRRLVDEAVNGEPAGVDVAHILAQLRGEALPEAPAAKAVPVAPAATTPAPPPPAAPTLPSPAGQSPPASEPALLSAPPPSLRSFPPPAAATPVPPAAAAPAPLKVSPPAASPPTTPPLQHSSTPSPAAPAFKVDTIRVDPQRLDSLLTLAGELNVTTTRVARGLSGFAAMVELWEEWNKDISAHRSLLGRVEADSLNGSGKALAAFLARGQGRLERLGGLLDHVRQTTYQDVTALDFIADEMEAAVRGMRLLPLSGIFNLYPRMVRDLARAQKKEIQFLVEGGETAADKRILEEMKDPLMHMIRNSVDHGVEPPGVREANGKPRLATVRLRAYQTATSVVIELSDDGRGLDLEAIRRTALKRSVCTAEELGAMSVDQVQMLIFAPGFSTAPVITDVSGRGVGMDVVRANIEKLKGSIQVETVPGRGCTFRIQCPVTLATTRVLLVEQHGAPYAMPVDFVEGMALVPQREVFRVEGRETICLHGAPLAALRLADLLSLPPRLERDAARTATAAGERLLSCVVITVGADRLGIFVDGLLDEQEVMLKPLGEMLLRVRNVSGATILGDGEVCMVLNPQDLLKSAQKAGVATRAAPVAAASAPRRKVVLLAEDSITTRTQEKRIIEGAGYDVVTAVDGLDAYNKLVAGHFDAVVSDIEMPNLGGLEFTTRIRQEPRYRELPVILVTTLSSDEDRRRGIEVGASAYITKDTFDQGVLVDTLRRLV